MIHSVAAPNILREAIKNSVVLSCLQMFCSGGIKLYDYVPFLFVLRPKQIINLSSSVGCHDNLENQRPVTLPI